MTISTATPAGQVGASLRAQNQQPSINSDAILEIARAALTPVREGYSPLLYQTSNFNQKLEGYNLHELADDVCIRLPVVLKNIYEEVFQRELVYALKSGQGRGLLAAIGYTEPSKPGQQTVIGGRLEGSSGSASKTFKEINDKINNILDVKPLHESLKRAIQTSSESALTAKSNFLKTREFVNNAPSRNSMKEHTFFQIDCKPVSFCQPAGQTVINFLSVEEKTSNDVKQTFIHAMQKLIESDDLNLEPKSAKKMIQRLKGVLRDKNSLESKFVSWFVDKELSRARTKAYQQSMRIIAENSQSDEVKMYFQHIDNVEKEVNNNLDGWVDLKPSAFPGVISVSSEPMSFSLKSIANKIQKNQPYSIEQHEQFYEEYRFDKDKDDGVSTRLQNVKVKLNNIYTSKDTSDTHELIGMGLMSPNRQITSFEGKVLKAYLQMVSKTRVHTSKDANGNTNQEFYVDEDKFGWGAVDLAVLAMVPHSLSIRDNRGQRDLSNILDRLEYLNAWFCEKDEKVFLEKALILVLALIDIDVRNKLAKVQKGLQSTLTNASLIEQKIKPALSKPILIQVRVTKDLINESAILTGDMGVDSSFSFINGEQATGVNGWWQYTSYDTVDSQNQGNADWGLGFLFSTTTEFKFTFRPLCLKQGASAIPFAVKSHQGHKVLTIIHDCLRKDETPLYSGNVKDEHGKPCGVNRTAFIIAHPEISILTCENMIEFWNGWCVGKGIDTRKFISIQSREAQVLFKQAFALSLMVYNFLVSRIVTQLSLIANKLCLDKYNEHLEQIHFLRAHMSSFYTGGRWDSPLYSIGDSNYYALTYSTARAVENELGLKTHVQGINIDNVKSNKFAMNNATKSLFSKNNISLIPQKQMGGGGLAHANDNTWVVVFSLRDAVHGTLPDNPNNELRYWHQVIESYKTENFVDEYGKVGIIANYMGSCSDIVSEDEPGGNRILGTAINETIAKIRDIAHQNKSSDDAIRPRVILVSKMLYSKRLGGAKEDVFKSITQQFIEYVQDTFDDIDIIPLNIHELSGVKSLDNSKDKKDFFFELVSDNQFVSVADQAGFEDEEVSSYTKKQQVLCSFATGKTVTGNQRSTYEAKIHSTALSYIYETDTRSQNKELSAEDRRVIVESLRTIHMLNAEKNTFKLNAFTFLNPSSIEEVGEVSLSYGKGYGSLVINLPAFLHAMYKHSIDRQNIMNVGQQVSESLIQSDLPLSEPSDKGV